MKKVKRLVERRDHRRPASVSSQLPPENEEDDTNIAPLARDATTVSLVQTGLCGRCHYLLLWLGFSSALVHLSSLDPRCRYCQRFQKMFQVAKGSEQCPSDLSQLYLCQEKIELKNPSDQFFYVKIRLGTGVTARYIHLFPTRVKWGDSGTHALGKYIEPNSPNFDMFKGVLRNCRARHTSTCTPSATDSSLLRLIDCRNRRIVSACRDQRYICLSYVWGNQVDEIRTIDGKLPDPVPKTVEDAMFVSIQFGVPFLWVDRYCIDQEKLKEKHNIIRNMDKIYHGAELTIIAVVGDDPHHGLPGVRGTPRKPQQHQLKLGADMYIAAEQGQAEINGSRWATRGWTYQEMLLSCRRLVFTKTQMYFQCMAGTSIESMSPELAVKSGLLTGSPVQSVSGIDLEELYRVFPRGFAESHEDAPDRSVRSYARYLNNRLCEYYKRQLSFGTDTIDAFLGIINFCRAASMGQKITQFYGVLFSYDDTSGHDLPRASFLEGLMWSISPPMHDEVLRRETTLYVVPHTFPSWSWASAKATLPADALGDLNCQSKSSQYEFDTYRGVDVRVQHQDDGILQVADVVYHDDDYKSFMPWIDITTWTRPCKVTRLSSVMGVVSLKSPNIIIQDPLALEKAEVHAICLNATGFVAARRMVSVSGLLVVETEPGLYRRVETFWWHIDLRDSKLADEFEEELQKALGLEDKTGDEERVEQRKRLKKGGWFGPHVLGRLRKDPWQRRTMRLI